MSDRRYVYSDMRSSTPSRSSYTRDSSRLTSSYTSHTRAGSESYSPFGSSSYRKPLNLPSTITTSIYEDKVSFWESTYLSSLVRLKCILKFINLTNVSFRMYHRCQETKQVVIRLIMSQPQHQISVWIKSPPFLPGNVMKLMSLSKYCRYMNPSCIKDSTPCILFHAF